MTFNFQVGEDTDVRQFLTISNAPADTQGNQLILIVCRFERYFKIAAQLCDGLATGGSL